MTARRLALVALAVVAPIVCAVLAVRVAAAPTETVIKVVAKRFDYTPGVLQLKRGVPVVIELTTQDVVMGFSAPDFGVRADIVPEKVARVRIVPDKAGTFTFVCDI